MDIIRNQACLMGSRYIEEESREGATAAGLNVGGMTFCMQFKPDKRTITIHTSIIKVLLTKSIKVPLSPMVRYIEL